MVRHIVAWNYSDGFSEEGNRKNAQKIKSELENLKGIIAGIVDIKVHINLLPSSNRDIVLNSLFESEEALTAYQIHPEHKRIGSFIASVTKNRICLDYHE